MNISWTLSRYLARQFLTVVLITFAVFLSLIFMLELVELLRRGAENQASHSDCWPRWR